MKNKIIVWYNPNKNSFYSKVVHGYYCKYEVGYVNSYNHKIVYIYNIPYTSREKKSIIDYAISPVIALLKFITRLLEKLTSLI